MTFGEKLREWGIKNYGSVNAFADALKMSRTSLSRYLNDKTEPGASILKQIRQLGCDMNWLLSDELELNQTKPDKMLDRLLEENRELKNHLINLVNQMYNTLEKDKEQLLKTKDLLKKLNKY